jgi:hypothetical protein
VLERAVLSLEFGSVRAFRLSGGQLTRDRRCAEQDRRHRIARRTADVSTAMAALLRLPVIAARHPTSARVQLIGDLIGAGVLPVALHGQVDGLTAIDDATWAAVSRLRDLIQPEEVEVDCWSFTLLDNHGRSFEVPSDYDPLEHSCDELPASTLGSVLDALTADGWQVTSWDVEHYPPECPEVEEGLDPLAAGLIRVVRYSLARCPGVSSADDKPTPRSLDAEGLGSYGGVAGKDKAIQPVSKTEPHQLVYRVVDH